MESVTLSDHLMFHALQRPPLQRRLLQKVAEIAPAIKGKISAVTRESRRLDHAVIEAYMTRTANESSPGINTRGDGPETCDNPEKREEKKEIHNQTSHLVQKTIFPKPKFHCIMLSSL